MVMRRSVVVLGTVLLLVASVSALIVEDEETADSYCTEAWPPAPMLGAPLWQKPTRPLILISGIAGSMLHTPLGTNPDTWKKLWIAFRSQNEIALEYMSGYFNGSMVVERFGHKVVPREDGFGLCSIDDLDPDLVVGKANSYYYHNMILYLISLGYVPGETLFGFPYDWRQSVRHPETLDRLHRMIHTLHNATTDRQPVDIMTHSMGGLVMKSYVSRFLEDSAGVLGRWTAIGTPWRGGGSLAYKAMISGYALDMTTIPIADWGLSESIAHVVELNWPSAFELMPDVDHDAWWAEKPASIQNPPRISYQIIGQDPAMATTSREVKSIITSVNANNMQIWKTGTPAVPNPISSLAWEHSDDTRTKLCELEQRLRDFRRQHVYDMTLEVTSIDGSQLDTKYSLQYNRAVHTAAELQQKDPDYLYVKGDGTVPYASARSDGLGAKHYEYLGSANHQKLLRTPEIFLGARHALGLECLIEGSWKVDIYAPDGKVFSTQYWNFGDETGMVKLGSVLGPSNDAFNTTLPDGTHITGTLDPACSTFTGTWYTTYRTAGTRILGANCRPGTRKTEKVEHGSRFRNCVYGNWSNQTHFLNCDEGYDRNGEMCVERIVPGTPPIDGNQKHTIRNAVIIACSVVAVIVLGVASYFIGRALCQKRARDTEYRTLPTDDAILNSDNALV